MNRTKLILLAAFILTLAAGMAVGTVVKSRGHTPPERGSMLVGVLKLSDAQREQMDKIWSELGPGAWQRYSDARKTAQTAFESGVRGLLNEEQLRRYEELIKERDQKLEDASKERTKAFEEADQRTKALLTEEQRSKLDELRLKMHRTGRERGAERGQRGPRPAAD